MTVGMSRVLLVGAFHETIELCEACGKEIVGIIVAEGDAAPQGQRIVGSDGEVARIRLEHPDVPLVIVPDAPQARERLARHFSQEGFSFATLVHPRALLSPSCAIGSGSTVQSGVTVSTQARTGEFVRLNTGATVMHDVEIGDFATVAPRATLLGGVSVGARAYIGAGSVVLPGVEIGRGAVVGAGAVVTRPVEAGRVVAGNPAREMKPSRASRER